MAISAGFQDIEVRRRLTTDFANIMRYTSFDKQREARDQRQYEQKLAIDQQERTKEQAGARLTSILASGLSTEEMYKAILNLQGQFKSTDLAGTSAGRGMFGMYGMMGRRAGGGTERYSVDYYKSLGLGDEDALGAVKYYTGVAGRPRGRGGAGVAGRPIPGAMTAVEEMEARYMKAKTAADIAADPESVAFWDRKLKQVRSGVPATEAELLGGMTDRIAVDQRIQRPETVVPPPSPVPPGFFEPRAPSTARTGDYDYAAAKAAGAKPDAQGHWPSEFKTDAHPDLFVDGLNTKTADLSQVIDVYTQMAVKQLGPSATREKVIALAKKLAKDKGWKIDE